MKEFIFYTVLTLLLLCTISIIAGYISDKEMQNKGAVVIQAVEKFRWQHGRLPTYVSELHLKTNEDECQCYQQMDSISYVVFFGEGFDKNYVYDSKTKQWRDEP